MIVIEFREAGTTGEYYYGITHNCSEDGFIFESETIDLREGTVLDLKLKHPEKEETINCYGDVVWTKKQKYGFVAKIKLHNVAPQKQKILAEIISLSPPPAESATRIELPPAQAPSAEDRGPAQNKRYSDIITESIVSSVSKNSAEETISSEERNISDAVPAEMRTEKSHSASNVNNRQEKKSWVFITVLIVLASVVFASYFIHNNSTEELKERPSHLLMNRNTASEVLPENRKENLPLNEIKEPANDHIELAPIIIETENTYLDTNAKTADGDEPSWSALTEAGEETVDPSPNSLNKPDKAEKVIAVIEEKVDPDTGFDQKVTDLITDEDSSPESLDKGPETGEAVAGKRFIIHVSAWKTKEYAMTIKKKIMRFYPDSIMVFENDYHVVMIPNIASREDALSISEELADRFDVSPLIYVQQRNIFEISKTD